MTSMDEKQKILIVDDERFNINVLSDLLKPNYKIMAAINGKQALKAAHSDNPPNLILLDVMMPEMDGYEVCKQLKADEKTRDIPVIFVTAMGQETEEEKGFSVGAVDYITKPITPSIVEARVKTQIALQQSMSNLQEAYSIINAQKQRMQDELNVGKDIQLSMLPQDFPAFPNRDEFSIFGSMQAAREVGGDFYDFFFIDEDRLCVCIGDVSGKGVPAALFMAITKVLIKSRSADDISTASILTHVNDEISENNDASMFITVFLGIIDVQTGEMTYTNAGHNPSYIKRTDGALERLDNLHGPVVGAIDGLAYKEGQVSLSKGDMLLMYTDGVTEAMDPEHQLFEENRLVEILKSGDYEIPEELIQKITSSVHEFENGAEQADDITLLSLLYKREKVDTPTETFWIAIRNQLSEIDTVNDEFEAFAEKHDISFKVIMRMKMVFDELLNNTISYGFQDEDEHVIEVQVDLYGERLMTTISDDGIPFNPFAMEKPDTSLSVEERDIGGLGIHLVQSTMDEFTYKRGIDKNQVTLIKYLDKE
ncbi:MAG: response regulator [Gammaproteobacteria bacterium]|nr:MAG: response regulator [Gammaproteobacteria bacterium]